MTKVHMKDVKNFKSQEKQETFLGSLLATVGFILCLPLTIALMILISQW